MQSLRRAVTVRLPSLQALSVEFHQQVASMASAAKGGKAADLGGGGDSKMQLMLRALQSQELKQVEMSAEELSEAERRSKEFSRRKMAQHRAWQTDLTTKLQLKLNAIAALPPDLQAAAMVPDLTPFPANRKIWTETPPKVEEDGAAAHSKQQQRSSKRTIGTKRR